MRRRSRAILLAPVLLALAASPATAATPGTSAQSLDIRLINYGVRPSATSTAPGRVSFVVHNADNVPHNLVVLRTDIAPRSLPVTGEHGRAREVGYQGATVRLRDEETVHLTLTLPAGRYLLICNVPGHYQRGMVAVLRVRH